MDHVRDFDKFKRLVSRMCVTFDKFATDEIVESWWKSLRTVEYSEIERRMDIFIAQATEKTKFPRPGQFRPDDSAVILDPRDEARERRMADDGQRNWRALLAERPTTGPIRLRLAQASRILATEHESSPAFSEAQHEYLALEKMLGKSGRFSADS